MEINRTTELLFAQCVYARPMTLRKQRYRAMNHVGSYPAKENRFLPGVWLNNDEMSDTRPAHEYISRSFSLHLFRK